MAVRRLRAFDESTRFLFSEEFHKLVHHPDLTFLAPVKGAVTTVKARGQYKTTNILLTDAANSIGRKQKSKNLDMSLFGLVRQY